MNGNRQYNCCPGRPERPNLVVNQGCGCGTAACNKETTWKDCPIAMAYVPWQDYGNIYTQPQALQNGTMFAELNLDFAGRRCN